MESWEILERAIPRAKSDHVGRMLGVSGDYVRKWRREPESDESSTPSGRRSILDRMSDLIDAVFLVNPPGAGLIVHYIEDHYDDLLTTHAKPIDHPGSRAETISALLTQTTEAINSLNLNGCTKQTLAELVEMRDAADLAIKQVEKTMEDTPF